LCRFTKAAIRSAHYVVQQTRGASRDVFAHRKIINDDALLKQLNRFIKTNSGGSLTVLLIIETQNISAYIPQTISITDGQIWMEKFPILSLNVANQAIQYLCFLYYPSKLAW
jgi:hypothetical protein